MDNYQFNNIQLDALKEISNIGVGNAATAMAMLLKTRVDMSVPAVNVVKLNELINSSGEKVVIGIIVRVVGDIPGNILILFDNDVAEEIVGYLLGKDEKLDSEIGTSVLCEVGNILSSSYMNAISKFTKLNVIASVPAVACDMMSAILSTTFMESGQFDEYILDIETVFLSEKDEKNEKQKGVVAHFYDIPAPGSLEKILKTIGI